MPTVTKKYYHNIDLDNNQLLNAVIENLTTAPTGPVDGQIYYNTVDKKIYYYNVSIPQWVEVGASLPANLITGTGTAGQVSYWNGTSTQAGSANFLWDNTLSKLTAIGFKTFQALAASENPTLGPDLYLTTGWTFTGAEWSGDGTTGFKHATGNTGLLTNNSIVAEIAGTYIISYTITERTAGFGQITFGGVTASLGIHLSSTIVITATAATGLSVTPQSTYNGRILFTSIKKVVGANTSPSIVFNDSLGVLQSEIRYGLNNFFIGKNAGYKTYGSFASGNIGIGTNALRELVAGTGNTAIGDASLLSIVGNGMNTAIGYNNMPSFKSSTATLTYNVAVGSNIMTASTFSGTANNAVGDSVLQRLTTGSQNVAMGDSAMLFLTTGGLNVGIGRAAGFYNTIGAQNTFIGANAGFINYAQTDNGVYIGYSTLPSANLVTNEIAIGHTTTGNGSNSVTLGNASITKTVLRGQIGIGIVTPVASAKVQIDSTTQGLLPPRMTAAERAAISSPAVGLIAYQTDGTEGLYQFKNTGGWSVVGGTTGSFLTVNNPTYTGILATGTLSYTPSAALATLQSSVVGYNQFVIQNSNNGSFSSSDFVVSNDLSTDSTYYGDFGMNSSQFAGTGSFALANAIYLYGSEGDLVLGTVTANDVHIVTDSSDIDSITVLTSGQILFPHYITNTSFTGTAAGIIGFTANGELITIDASTIGSGTVTSVEIAAGTGISLSGTNPITSSGIITVTNSAPDQVVTLTANTGITVEGTYPSFNLINSDKGSSQNIFKSIAVNAQTTITAGSNNETLTVTAGTGVSVTTNNTTKTLTITNSAPDQAVSLTAGTATTISGTYPNFTIGASYTPVNKAGDTMLGNLTLVGSPTNVLHAATKQYVDEQTSAGLHIHEPVRAETPTALTATYTNGGTTHTVTAVATNDTLTIGTHSLLANDVIVFNSTLNGITSGVAYFVYDAPSSTSIRLSDTYGGNVISSLTNGTGLNITSRANAGVGATLTNAGAQAALVIDGVTLQVGNRVMIRQQVNAYENGVYVVTNVGSGSTNWVLTRSSDANKYSPADTMTLGGGDYFFTSEGSVMAGDSHVLTTTGVIIFGTTDLTFEQFSGAVTYTGGTNITVTGQTIALTGQVAVANGGTGASTLTGVLVGDGTNPVSGVTGTASQLLRRNSGNTAYEFFSPTYTTRTLSIVSANTTAAAVANTDYVYLVSGTSIITLPTAVGNTSKYTIKNTGTNTVTVNTTSSQTIDGSTSINLAVRYTALEFISDGSNWNII